MLLTIEKYAIRTSACLWRCFSRSLHKQISANDSLELISQSSENHTSIHREVRKSLRIAFLGAPNVGKSTLVNQLVKRTVIIFIYIFCLN